MMKIVIETQRLLLRTFTSDDAPLIFELNLDPEVIRYTLDPIRDIEHARQVLDKVILPQYALYNHGRWAVLTKPDKAFIGWCGLKKQDQNGKKLISVIVLSKLPGAKDMPLKQPMPAFNMGLKNYTCSVLLAGQCLKTEDRSGFWKNAG